MTQDSWKKINQPEWWTTMHYKIRTPTNLVSRVAMPLTPFFVYFYGAQVWFLFLLAASGMVMAATLIYRLILRLTKKEERLLTALSQDKELCDLEYSWFWIGWMTSWPYHMQFGPDHLGNQIINVLEIFFAAGMFSLWIIRYRKARKQSEKE